MRANEFLTEAIQLVQYEDDLRRAIYDGVIETLKNISQFRDERVEQDALKLDNPLGALINVYFNSYQFDPILDTELTFALSVVLNEIIADRYANYTLKPRKKDPQGEEADRARAEVVKDAVDTYHNTSRDEKIKFVKMKPLGRVRGLQMFLNKEYLRRIAKFTHVFIMNHGQHYSKSTDPVEMVFGTIDAILDKGYPLVHAFLDTITFHLIKTIEHEMVHIIQHFEQTEIRKLDDTQYRSYAQRDIEHFKKAMQNKDDPQNRKIYVSSPQEISAFAHNMVLDIIENDLSSQYPLTANTISDRVQKYLASSLPNPTTPVELKVYKRYLRLVYQGIIDHIERENQDRRKNRQLRVSNQGKLPK